jgi:anhydro-N-acetylmuramic acid kinase
MRALGLMSGTSMDGIDVALIETDGENLVQRGPCATFPYSLEFRAELSAAAEAAKALGQAVEPSAAQHVADLRAAAAKVLGRRDQRPGVLGTAEQRLTRLHAEAVAKFLADNSLNAGMIDVIGLHGHTVLHAPEQGLTVQIGDGKQLAQLTGTNVVYDLRAADVAAGGQGAPLAPVYHRALVARLPERPVAVVNVGGVGNVTWIGRDGTLIAFDTGPGNALIDDWMLRRTGTPCDAEGACAAAGTVDERALTQLMSHRFFAKPPPKSLDRNAFPADPVAHLSTEDGAATLTAFTAAAIAAARANMPQQPGTWVICGGGRKNKTLMAMLAERVENAVVPAEAASLDGDAVEAEAWAYLAVRSLQGWPITFPGTTGVPRPMVGGKLARK